MSGENPLPVAAPRLSGLVDHRFNSASELEALLASIGFAAQVLQLEGGILQGRFQFLADQRVALLRLQSSHAISVGCPRKAEMICCGLVIDGKPDLASAHGQPIAAHAVAGVSLALSHSFFQFRSGADVVIALLPKQHLVEQLEICGGEQCLRWMQSHNQLLLHQQAHQTLVGLLLHWLADPSSIPSDPIAAVVRLLNDDTVQGAVPFRRVMRFQLVFDLIALGASGAAEGLDLDQLADRLSCSRRSLIQGCKELLGVGPKEVLRIQRLEQVHQALLRHDPKTAVEPQTVNAVAERFGFQSRGHFAAAYRRQFGQLPAATLRKRA